MFSESRKYVRWWSLVLADQAGFVSVKEEAIVAVRCDGKAHDRCRVDTDGGHTYRVQGSRDEIMERIVSKPAPTEPTK